MTDLVTWLRAQVDDDERMACEADRDESAPWKAYGDDVDAGVATEDGGVIRDGDGNMWLTVARHIAHWDPARVLAEVDAKRRILDLHSPEPSHYVNGRYISTEPGDLQCAHCTELCHSRSGLGCDQPDAPWPCPTVRLLVPPYADRSGFDPLWAKSRIR